MVRPWQHRRPLEDPELARRRPSPFRCRCLLPPPPGLLPAPAHAPVSSRPSDQHSPPFSQLQAEHTIVLMQPTTNKGSRTFKDYDSVDRAIDGEVLPAFFACVFCWLLWELCLSVVADMLASSCQGIPGLHPNLPATPPSPF